MNTIILEYNILRYAYAKKFLVYANAKKFLEELLRRLATANRLLRCLTLVKKRE
jgi:hypothetical protein